MVADRPSPKVQDVGSACTLVELLVQSAHPGGARFLFADGQVAFLPESINQDTFIVLAARAEGDLVGNYGYYRENVGHLTSHSFTLFQQRKYNHGFGLLSDGVYHDLLRKSFDRVRCVVGCCGDRARPRVARAGPGRHHALAVQGAGLRPRYGEGVTTFSGSSGIAADQLSLDALHSTGSSHNARFITNNETKTWTGAVTRDGN